MSPSLPCAQNSGGMDWSNTAQSSPGTTTSSNSSSTSRSSSSTAANKTGRMWMRPAAQKLQDARQEPLFRAQDKSRASFQLLRFDESTKSKSKSEREFVVCRLPFVVKRCFLEGFV